MIVIKACYRLLLYEDYQCFTTISSSAARGRRVEAVAADYERYNAFLVTSQTRPTLIDLNTNANWKKNL